MESRLWRDDITYLSEIIPPKAGTVGGGKMKKGICFFGSSIFCFIFMIVSQCGANDGWQDIGREILNARTLLVDQVNPKVIYAGTEKGIFKSEDKGLGWRNIFITQGSAKAVNLLISDYKDHNVLFAATGSGLFYSSNNGSRWGRIFKGKNYLEADCTALAVLPSGIYLGTKQGFFISRDKGRTWQKELGKLGNSRVFNIAYSFNDTSCLYIASTDGIFKSKDSGKSWERIFVAHASEDGLEADNEYGDDERDQEIGCSEIRYVAVNPNNLNYLYLATSRGIYESKDGGISWEMFPEYGLLSRDVYFLLFSRQSQFYCIGRSGIFTYQNSAWQELSFNLSLSKG